MEKMLQVGLELKTLEQFISFGKMVEAVEKKEEDRNILEKSICYQVAKISKFYDVKLSEVIEMLKALRDTK